MDLSLHTTPVVPWQQEQGSWKGRMRCSSSQVRLLARRPLLVRYSAEDGEANSSQENQVHVKEAVPAEPVRSVDMGSWLQGNVKNNDPYLGWTSNGSDQPLTSSASGWIKIGGVAVLAIGFTLGARSIYLNNDISKQVAVSPPASEEVAHTSSKVQETINGLDHSETNEKSGAPNTNSGGPSQEEKEGIGREVVPDVQHQQESTQDGVSSLNGQKEDDTETESRDKSLPTAIVPISETSKQEENLVSSAAANDKVLSCSEDAEEEESDAVDVASTDVDTSEDVSESAKFTDKDGDLDVELSTQTFTSFEGNNAGETFEELDDPVSRSEELAEEGSSLFEDATSLPERTSDEFSLQNIDTVEDLQGPFPIDFGNLAGEGGFEAAKHEHDEWGEGKFNADLFGSLVESTRQFSPASITAPSTPSSSLLDLTGKVVVPAPVDHMQEQVLAALQALKVIDADVKPGDICTRREYARWLVASSIKLTRSPAHKVLPAMYIENASLLAYEDVVPEDRDFPFIQGLAEAGLLSSRLLGDDKHQGGDDETDFVFAPDSPLTRQDLVTWKVALARKPAVMEETPLPDGIEAVKKKLGFMDADKVDEAAWPALLVDVNAGEQSIIALAFGHTRRLQPHKPVSKAQAAVALATGEAWELVAEELTRLEADSVAEAAVVAELALETKAQQEAAAAFAELLQIERSKRQEAARVVESTRAELERVLAEHESEKHSLLKERAALDSQKEFQSSARYEVEEQGRALANAKVEVAFQREQANKLRVEAEEEKALISKVRSELEVEKNALILARSWAEDEAKKAQAHSRVLEGMKSRLESGDVQADSAGIQVGVEKELDDGVVEKMDGVEKIDTVSPSWQYREGSENQSTPMDSVIQKGRDIRQMIFDAFIRFLHFVQLLFHALKERAANVFGHVGVKFHEVRSKCADGTAKTVEGLKQTVPSSMARVTSSIRDGTSKAVDEWKGGAERLSQKFKTS